MRGGDDNGVGWLIREGCVSRGGTKGREAGGMKWRDKAAQALINPYQPHQFAMDMRSGARARVSSSSPCALHPTPSGGFVHTY